MKKHNFSVNGNKKRTNVQEKRKNHLIRSRGEEAIIRQEPIPDISFDLIQIESIQLIIISITYLHIITIRWWVFNPSFIYSNIHTHTYPHSSVFNWFGRRRTRLSLFIDRI